MAQDKFKNADFYFGLKNVKSSKSKSLDYDSANH